jgi:hypothetical protein
VDIGLKNVTPSCIVNIEYGYGVPEQVDYRLLLVHEQKTPKQRSFDRLVMREETTFSRWFKRSTTSYNDKVYYKLLLLYCCVLSHHTNAQYPFDANCVGRCYVRFDVVIHHDHYIILCIVNLYTAIDTSKDYKYKYN